MEDLRSDPLLARNSQVEGYILLPPCVLFSRIGSGGMGAVYRGHHLNLDIEVAIKCLKPSLVDDDPTFVDRFKREARSAAQINHQNVIRVFDVAESQGLNYLIMEFVQGETARQRVERKRELAISEALEIVYEASLGLGEAHRIGIVHRDIKPDNLLVSVRGQVKVADLGLAKPSIGGGQSVLSMAGQVMGTPPYMPPEQWGDGPITPSADVWAMGAVLYYLLAGEEAIYADSVAAIMTKIVTRDFPDVRELRPDVPDNVVAVIAKATASDPLDRFADATELADAIASLPEHRISLVDNDAGTTELRTMLSPPPSPQIAEIKRLFSEGKITRPTLQERAEPSPETAQATAVAPRRGLSGAVLLLLLLVIGGGGAGIAWRAGWLGPAPEPVAADTRALAEVLQLENRARFVEALRRARALVAQFPEMTQKFEFDRLRTAAQSSLEARFRLEPVAEVIRGRSVTLRGSYTGDEIDKVLVAGRACDLRDGAFSIDLVPSQAELIATVEVTAQDRLQVGQWTFELVDAPAVDFVGELTTDPPLGQRNAVGVAEIKVLGTTNEAGAEIRLGDQLLGRSKPDRTFEVRVPLADEGANELRLTAGREGQQPTASKTLTVVRLIEPPMLKMLAPDKNIFGTSLVELPIEFEVGEWANRIVATLGGKPIQLREQGRRRMATVSLAEGGNDIDIEVVNLVGNRSLASLRVTYTAPVLPPPKITSVTLRVGGEDVKVQAGARRIVAGPATLRFRSDAAGARLLVDGRSRTVPYRLPLVEGTFTRFRIEAALGQRRSEPFAFEVALDSTPPALTAQPVTAVAAGEQVVLRGQWREAVAIDAIRVRGGAAASLTDDGKGRGGWSVSVKAGTTTRSFELIARDVAGNESAALAVEVPVVVASKPSVDPPGQPGSKLAADIDAKVFTAVGELNQLGYPPRLRHRSGVELVAIDFRNDRKPTLYAAVRMVTVGQWDGNGDTDRKVGIDGRTIIRQLATRLPKLDLPTIADWDRLVADETVEDTKAGGYREWLRPDKLTATVWPIRKDNSGATTARDNESSRYRGFRVVFRP